MPNSVPLCVSVLEAKQLLDSEAKVMLLDCRTQEEFDIVNIDGATLIPMDQLESRVSELNTGDYQHLLVYCHAGVRSEMVARWLRQQGFDSAQSMSGGIDQWASEIDTSLPKY